MASREYDIVVFGASAFTGQYVVEYLARITYGENARYPNIRWAIAGRSVTKLRETLKAASAHVPGAEEKLGTISYLTADVSNPASLEKMCASTRIILNIVGPYEKYGEPVVKAAIEQKTHYLDLSGEPYFIENMVVKYNNLARENGVIVVSAVGFDCIPVETLFEYLENHFGGELNSVEGYVQFKAPLGYPIHTGTYLSAIGGISNWNKLGPLRREIYKNYKKVPQARFKLQRRSAIHYSNAVKGWCIPFLGTDRSVVTRTQRDRFEFDGRRPIQFGVYMRIGSLFSTLLLVLWGAFFGISAKIPGLRWFISTFPRLASFGAFSEAGPSRKQIEATTFQYTLVGRGWSRAVNWPAEEHNERPERELRVELHAPDPGYGGTAIALVEAATRLLECRDRMPAGGVLTPGMAFRSTGLIEALEKAGYRYTVAEQTTRPKQQ